MGMRVCFESTPLRDGFEGTPMGVHVCVCVCVRTPNGIGVPVGFP